VTATEPSVLIADHAPTRVGATMALSGVAVVCAEAGDVEEAIRAAARTQPDVCLIGLEIPGGGINAVRGISEVSPGSAVIVLAGVSDVEDLLASVRAGAIGYIPGGVDAERLRRVVRAAAQILGMLRRGHSTSEIASRLAISPVTVRRHISELVRKVGVTDRAGLVPADGGLSQVMAGA
jgi:two-component system nitrate/nitrite response regulator NarL